jgi:hypothetical protein
MTLAAKIAKEVRDLPDELAREVLDFITNSHVRF